MTRIIFPYLLFLVLMAGCFEKPRAKFFIQSVKIHKDVRIDWYVHSSVTNFAPDYLQISTNDKEPFFVSFFLTGMRFANDSLYISLWQNSYERMDETKLNGIKLVIDTTGEQWNGGTSRIGRLQRIGVNVEVPHFVDVFCLKGDCNNFSTSTLSK